VLFDSQMNFLSSTHYSLAGAQFVLADLNGDGLPDLIVATTSASLTTPVSINVLIGNGGASFQPPIQHVLPGPTADATGVSFAVGDVNGDGKPDLVLGIAGPRSGGGTISFLAGNGDGTFQDGGAIASDIFADSVALADLNGDGKLDLVCLSNNQNFLLSLSVALGVGNGSFGAFTTYAISGAESFPGYASLTIGDVDGDGVPDIASGALTILFGDGKGAFPRRGDYLWEGGPGLVLADLDGDGRMDIVAGAYGNAAILTGSDETSAVFFGRGGGTFWGAPATGVAGVATVDNFGLAVATADFNGDGIPDLAYSDFGRISILLGSSTGFFTAAFQYQEASPLVGLPLAMLAADFTGDGKPDLAVVLQPSVNIPNYVALFPGKGDGTLQAPIAIALPVGLSAASLAAGDFNGDGRLDLAAVVNTQNGGAADQVLIFLGDGDGSFRAFGSYNAGPVAFAIVAVDLNGDGKPDLAITNEGTVAQSNGTVSILLGKGDGTFSPAPAVPISGGAGIGPYSITTADFNGDGKPDLAVTLSNDTTYGGGLAVLLGRGDGTFQPPVVYPVSSAGVTAGDFNGDGIPDLVVSIPRSEDAYPGVGYLLGKGDGTFAPEVQFADEIGPLIPLDLNRDGKLDLAGADHQFGVVAFINASQPQPAFTVVSAASLTFGPVAPGSLASAFGRNLSAATAAVGAGQPPIVLGGQPFPFWIPRAPRHPLRCSTYRRCK